MDSDVGLSLFELSPNELDIVVAEIKTGKVFEQTNNAHILKIKIKIKHEHNMTKIHMINL